MRAHTFDSPRRPTRRARPVARLAPPLLALGILLGSMPAAGAATAPGQPAWIPANGGFYGAVIYTLARDPNLPAIRYAGGTQGFLRTLDGGATWQEGNAGLPPGCEVSTILPLRSHPATLLAGCFGADYGNGLYRSDDRGLHWQAAGAGMVEDTPVDALIQGVAGDGTLLAATDTGIYRSTDVSNWLLVLKGSGGVLAAYSLAHDPFSALTYYAGTSAGAYKSLDAGATWFAINNDLGAVGVIDQIAADPTKKDRLFLATQDNGIYRSTDGGNSWSHLDNGPTHAYALAVQPLKAVPAPELTPDLKRDLAFQIGLARKKLKKGQPRPVPEYALLFAGTDNGVQASIDGGDNWGDRTADANQKLPSAARPYPGLPENTGVYALLGFGRSAELLAGGTGDGIYRSRDLARSWAGAGAALPQNVSITALAVDPAAPGTAYLGTAAGGVWRVDGSGGKLVTSNDGLPQGETVNDLLIQPARQDRLVAALGAPRGGVAISTGGGWSLQSVGLGGRFVDAVIADPHDADTLYAGLSRGGVGWSANGGQSWQRLHTGLPPEAAVLSLAVDAHDALRILAGTDAGLYLTVDQGDHWVQGGAGLPVGAITALLDDPSHPRTFLAGTGGGLFRSVDGGATWQPLHGLLDGVAVTRLVRDPLNGAMLAATGLGVARSQDGGASWSLLERGLPSAAPATAVAAAGAVDYAGTPYGVYFLSPTGPVAASGAGVYFPLVGHGIRAPFLTFWQAHGGLPVFGYPRTEPLREGGVLVQYFQRARLEYHPGIGGVVLTPLGTAFSRGRTFGRVKPFPDGPLRIFVRQTRHSLARPFLAFWRQHGGAAVFGYPISEVLHEENGDGTGQSYVLQYFQNARLEYHPEATDPRYTIQLGLLGDQLLRQKGWLQ